MINLTGLSLPANSDISDLSPIAGLTRLRHLSNLGNFVNPGYKITDLSPLAGLTELEYVGILVGSVEDWTPLGDLPNLTELKLISWGPQGDMSPLENLTGLHTLELFLRGEADRLPSLSGMTQLSDLKVEAIDMVSLDWLRGASGLKTLMLRDDFSTQEAMLDLSPLSSLSGLESLELSVTKSENGIPPVAGLEPIGALSGLRTLTLDIRHISDISPLRDLTGLQSVIINSNGGVTDWSPVDHVPSKSLN